MAAIELPRTKVMGRILVDVKQKHIDEGKRSTAVACPVALAFADTFPEDMCHHFSTLPLDTLAIDAQGHSLPGIRFWHPTELRQFVKAVDWGEPVKPGKYWVDVLKDGE